MDDAFFESDAQEQADWLALIDDAVQMALEQYDVDSLAPLGTPKDWVDLVDEILDWTPFEEIVATQHEEWKKQNDGNVKMQNGGSAEIQNGDLQNGGDCHVDGPCLPPLYNYEDLVISKTSSFLELQSSLMGRYVEASSTVEAGEIIIEEKPFASMLRNDSRKTHCSNCYKRMKEEKEIIACQRCNVATFCSKKCCEEATIEFHQFECPFITGLFTLKIIPLSLRMLLRGWRNIMHHFLHINGLQPNTKKAQFQVPTEETLTFDMSVVPGRHCYQHAIAAKFVLEMAKQSGLVELLRKGIRQGARDGLEGCEQLLEGHLEDFLKCVIFVNIHKIKFNSFEIHEYQMQEKQVEDKLFSVVNYQRVGAAMYPSTSEINHSCRPNANFFFKNDHIVVKSNQRIEKGQEIFISYGPTIMSIRSTNERRKELMENYGFLCQCPFCRQDEEEEEEEGEGEEEEEEEEVVQEEKSQEEEDDEDEEKQGTLSNIIEAYNLEQQVRELLSYAFDAVEVLQFEGAAAALLRAKRHCLEIEDILKNLDDNPRKAENEKCAFNLSKEVDEFMVMSYGLLGNKHIMCA